MGLVEAGSSVVDLLRRKAESPFRKLEVQQWRAHDPTAPPEQRPSLLERRMRDVFAGIVDQLGFDPKRLDEERLGAARQSWMREE